MIDRESRDKLAEEIRHFVECFSTNFEYDDAAFKIKTKDVGVIEIRQSVWMIYDDLREHKLNGKWTLSNKQLDIIKRCIVFLKSNEEYKWPRWPLYYRILRPLIWMISLGQLVKIFDQHFNSNGELEVWPFFMSEEYETAKAQPVYLNKNA